LTFSPNNRTIYHFLPIFSPHFTGWDFLSIFSPMLLVLGSWQVRP